MDIVLVRPENPGNIGAVARVMKNFGFSNLVLVDPCEITDETKRHAKHAYDVIRNARVLKSFDSKKYDYVMGTTGIVGSERPCVSPEEARSVVPKGRVAVLFGNEGRGLTKDEPAACDALVHIKPANDYAVMNLSHAVAIVLYELGQAEPREAAGRAERETLVHAFINALGDMEPTEKGKASEAFRCVVNRSPPTPQETAALTGAFKKTRKNKRL